MELPEHRSVAKKHLIEAVQALGEKLLLQGGGNKTDPIDYLEHPVPLLWGEFGKQDLFVSKGGPPWVGWGIGILATL